VAAGQAAGQRPRLSFEFFPPRTPEGLDRLRGVWTRLAGLDPEFFSVTYGAGGSTRERTLGTVLSMAQDGHAVAPHLSCIGSVRQEMASALAGYRERGISRIIALRGDLPSGVVGAGDFQHADALVRFIREHSGPHFHISVACYPEFHPQSASPAQDLRHFRRKVDAGADAAITQFFFNADAYFRFLDQCRAEGIGIPILPGIMPIGNFSQLARFSDACGAEIPRWVRLRMQAFGDDADSIRSFGLDVVSELCARLLAQGVPGLHFYTLNHAELSLEISRRLGLC
jgi:methylenetetrahydrofolate reductase (NADPH)